MDIHITPAGSINEITMELLLTADPSETIIQEYLQRGFCYVARNNTDIVGVIAVVATKPKTLEIVNIAVKEQYQNKGIGKRLIAFIVEKAKEENQHTIEIGTGNPGVQQMLLYQKCGFRIVGVDLDYFRRHYPERIFANGIECRDMIRMQMDLS